MRAALLIAGIGAATAIVTLVATLAVLTAPDRDGTAPAIVASAQPGTTSTPLRVGG